MNSSSEIVRDAEPKYVWFAGHLRRQIEEGLLKPGDRLPSRTEIHELHKIAQPTIERAQAILEREGLIVRRKRQGVFVADRPAKGGFGVAPRNVQRLASGTIGILAPNEGEVSPGHRQPGWSDYITQGAIAACRRHGKHALLLNPERLQGEELEQLLAQPPLGFVFASLTASVNFGHLQNVLEALRSSSQPFVVYGSETAFENFDRVVCDHETGCYELTRWLIESGCRRILPFWPPIMRGQNWLEQRYAGYRRAMEEAGLEVTPIREVPMRHLPTNPDSTREAFNATTRHKVGYLADLLTGEGGFDAIMEVSDGEVATTAAACRLLGFEPNRDILIAGYDNYWSDITERLFEATTPIATVDKHNWETGGELVDVLLERVNGKLPGEPHRRVVRPQLVPLDNPASHPHGNMARELVALSAAAGS